jgi:hypothetical protein
MTCHQAMTPTAIHRDDLTTLQDHLLLGKTIFIGSMKTSG